MMSEDKIAVGLLGTSVSALGTSLSVSELQAIISIIVTIVGFVISVLIPLITKLVNKIKAAKEDGKIDKKEMEDILSTGKEIVDKTESLIKEVSEKNQKENK